MRLFKLHKVLIFVLICILLAFSIQDGKRSYKTTLVNSKLFQETEKFRVKQYLNYTYYGWYGVALMFVPGSSGVITPGIYNELNANVNSGERLTIHNQLKGRNLFADNKFYMDFSGLIILMGCLICLTYGFEAVSNKEYLMFLASLSSPTRVVASILGARIILMTLIFLGVAGFSLLVLLMNGINMFNVYYLWFLVTTILIFTLFLLMGASLGTIKHKITGVITLCAVYFFFVFLLPLVIIKSTQFKADSIQSSYKTELENLKLVMHFEQKVRKEGSDYSETAGPPSEKTIKMVKEILNRDVIKFQEREENTKNEILGRIKYYHALSSFFPISFYISLCNEIGSKGYLNFIDFYSFSQKQKARFIDFYVRKKFFSPLKSKGIESFIKGNENLYFSKSRLPRYFGWGLGLMVLYILVLVWVVFYRFNKLLTRDRQPINNFAINIESGKLNLLLTGDPAIRHHPYSYFSGTSQTPPITINGKEAKELGFVYLPNPQNFPGVARTTIQMVFPGSEKCKNKFFWPKRVAQKPALWEILFEAAKKTGKVIIFDDFFVSLRGTEIEKIKQEIATHGINSLYITKNEYMAISIVDNLIFCTEDMSVDEVRLFKGQ